MVLDISKAFDRVGMLVFFTNISLIEFQVRYLALFLLFLVIDNFKWFWMESFHKKIQLMLEFFKALFLVLHFSYYTSMIFLMMLSVILLSMLMILLSILSVIGHLICGNNLNWLLNLNLIYETLWTGVRSGLMISMLEKLSWFHLTGLIKFGALIHSVKFLSLELALYFYKSTIHPCMEYCCHIWAGAPSCYLKSLDKLQKWICRIVGPSLSASLQPLAHRSNVASLSRFHRNYFGRCSSEPAQLAPLPFFSREVYSLF